MLIFGLFSVTMKYYSERTRVWGFCFRLALALTRSASRFSFSGINQSYERIRAWSVPVEAVSSFSDFVFWWLSFLELFCIKKYEKIHLQKEKIMASPEFTAKVNRINVRRKGKAWTLKNKQNKKNFTNGIWAIFAQHFLPSWTILRL